jgi:transcriptional regulator with XRE-family HTH domain
MPSLTYKQKLSRVLAFSGWSRDRLADLLEVSNNTFNAWIGGKSEPHAKHAERIDWIYNELVQPLIPTLELMADKVEKTLLEERIEHLPDDNTAVVG